VEQLEALDWFTLVQSVGIIFSILISALAFSRETRTKKVSNYLQLVQFHRDIWKLTLEYPQLNRVRKHNVDLLKEPPTSEERQFLSFIFLHITCTFELQNSNSLSKIERLEYDVNQLLSYPIVRHFWEENKRFYNEAFVRFVDGAARIG